MSMAPKTHAKISTGQRSTKFGVSTSQNEAAGLLDGWQKTRMAPAGLAVHIGSQIMDLDPFERAYGALLEFGTALRSEVFLSRFWIWVAASASTTSTEADRFHRIWPAG